MNDLLQHRGHCAAIDAGSEDGRQFGTPFFIRRPVNRGEPV